MRLRKFFMPIVFSLNNDFGKLKVTCKGCRELVPQESPLPSHLKGMIEYEGLFIPVIDPSSRHSDDSVELTNDSCILVVGHEYKGTKLYTGIIAGSFQQILELSINSEARDAKACGANVCFALEIFEQASDSHANRLLWHNHLLLRELVLWESCDKTADVVTC